MGYLKLPDHTRLVDREVSIQYDSQSSIPIYHITEKYDIFNPEAFINYQDSQLRKSNIKDIIETNRNCGSSTWILKSAIVNPDCVIVSRDRSTSDFLIDKIMSLITGSEIFTEIYENNDRRLPEFITLSQSVTLRGRDLKPVIFDNSCFF